MSTLAVIDQPRRGLEQPLDEAVWQTWVAKGRAEELRTAAASMQAVKWASIAGLLTAAAFGPEIAAYDVAVRFIVTVGALVMMVQAFQTRRYVLAAVFGELALLYNPVAPVFTFSGGWQLAVLLASTVPFVAALAWPRVRTHPQ
jgi:hypothetical protein